MIFSEKRVSVTVESNFILYTPTQQVRSKISIEKMVVKRMRNRAVFILIALITVVAGCLFVLTTDAEAAESGQDTDNYLENVSIRSVTSGDVSISVHISGYGYVYSTGIVLDYGENNIFVSKGTNKEFVFVPHYGYKIDKVEINGVNNTNAVKNGSYTFNNVQSAQSLMITFDRTDFNITIEQRSGGTIVASEKISAMYSTRKTVDLIPSVGYDISKILIDGEESVSAKIYKRYEFTMTRDFSVVIELEHLSYVISHTVSSGSGTGTISMVGSGTVIHGNDRTFNITPATGYRISSVILGTEALTGAELEAVRALGKYTFHDVTEAKSITVGFENIVYKITVVTDGNGTVNNTSFNILSVPYDSDLTIQMVPYAGYLIKSINIDGTPIFGMTLDNAKNTEHYTLKGIQRSQTISITFEKITLHVSISTNGGGTVFSETEIKWKTDQVYEFRPEKGYYVKEVWVNGKRDQNAESNGFHVFEKIERDHSLYVAFAKTRFEITSIKDMGISREETIFTVEYGASRLIDLRPPMGYLISSLKVNGKSDTSAMQAELFEFKNVTSDQTIQITFAKKSYIISIKSMGGGPESSEITASYGDPASILIVPEFGKMVSSVTVNGIHLNNVELDIIRISKSYRISSVKEPYDINVTFEKIVYKITFLSVGNGTINSKNYGTEDTLHGDITVLSVIPDKGNFIKTATVNGKTMNNGELTLMAANKELRLYGVIEDHLISITFEKNTYTVKTESEENGTIWPNSSMNLITVQHGDEFALNIFPNAGYMIGSVQCNGEYAEEISSIRETGQFNVHNISSDLCISVFFERIQYTIFFSTEGGGSINEKTFGTETVLHGKDVDFSITPSDGFRIANVLINGTLADPESIKKEKGYSFTDVVSNNTLMVSFERIIPRVTVSMEGEGTVSPGTSEFEWKGYKNFEFRPREGHYIKSVLINGTENEEARKKGSFFFEMLQSEHTLHVIFARIEFSIIVKKNTDGILTTEEFIVGNNEHKKIRFEPVTGCEIRSVLIDGIENENARIKGSVDLENIVKNYEIFVTISRNEYTLSLDISGNGTVIPDKTKMTHGDDLRIDIFPGTGSVLRAMMINGQPMQSDMVGTIATRGYYVMMNISNDREVKVVFEEIIYTIKFSSLGNGNINSVSGGEKGIHHGGDVFFSIIPHPGCYVKDVIIDGIFLKENELLLVVENGGFSFSNVKKDHSMSATFERITYSVKIAGGKNGTVTPGTANDIRVQHGYGFTFYAHPEIGYRVSSAGYNGTEITAAQMQTLRTSGKVTLDDVTFDLDILVSFEKTPYNISFSAGEGGNVNGKMFGKETVLHGNDVILSILPADGFKITEIKIDGIVDTNMNEYVFVNVTKDHELKVLFEPIVPVITITSTDGGDVSPYSIIEVSWNGHQIFNFNPAEGHYIKSVIIDGTENTEAKTRGSYFFNNVQNDHTLHIVFAKKGFCITVTKDTDGKITTEKIGTVYGETKKIDIVQTEGYDLVSVLVDLLEDGQAISNGFTEFENINEDHIVSIVVKRITYDLSLTFTGNGTLTSDKDIVCYGTDVIIAITPKEWNVLSSVTIDGIPLTDTELNLVKATGTYTLSNIIADHSIMVVFEEILYNITYSSGEHGNVNAGTYERLVVSHGTDVELYIIPDTGYRIESIAVDGSYLKDKMLSDAISSGKIAFDGVTKDHSIVVSFTRITYTVTIGIEGNGSIVPNGISGIVLNYGEEVRLTIIPGKGHRLSVLEIDNVKVSNDIVRDINDTGAYTMKGNSDHSVKAYFENCSFSVSVTSDANGTVLINDLPGPVFHANHGETVLVSFTPNKGYQISDVIVNNVSSKNSIRTGEYEIQNLNFDHQIGIIFERIVINILVLAETNGITTYVGDKGGIHMVSSDPLQRMYGDGLEMNISPSEGYRLKRITENGKELSEEKLADVSVSGKYVLSDLTEDVDVSISFERIPYNMFLTVEGSGSLIDGNNVVTRSFYTPISRTTEILSGDAAVFDIVPSTGYCIDGITVNGKELKGEALENVKNDMRYIFQKIENNSSIEVKFKKIPFTVSAVTGENGSLSKEGITDVQYGDSFYLEFYPNNNYKVKEVIINGESNRTAAENGYYILEDIQNDVSILVSYESIHKASGTSVGVYVLSIVCVASLITLIYGLFALKKVRKLSKG